MEIALSVVAAQAIKEQSDYYLQCAGPELAKHWDDAVLSSIRSLRSFPERGKRHQWSAVKLKGLRSIAVSGFPRHLIFYLVLANSDSLLVVHVLHSARDIASILSE